MVMRDPESFYPLRRKLEEKVSEAHNNIVIGSFPDMAAFERQRGIIVGIGVALDLLDQEINPQPLADEQSEGNTNDQTTA